MHDTYVVYGMYVVLGPLPTYTLSPTHTASKVDINYDTLHYNMKYYIGVRQIWEIICNVHWMYEYEDD